MRKLTVTENLSLDGVMEKPEIWGFPYNTDDMTRDNMAGANATDALIFGRITYEEFAAIWPNQTSEEPGFADMLNKVRKFVVSSSLKKADWNNSTIIKENAVEEITRMKQQSGKSITIIGSATLVQSLMQSDVIDEYQLFIYPVVVGSGKHLFKDGMDNTALKLVESKTYSSGVTVLTYQPAKK